MSSYVGGVAARAPLLQGIAPRRGKNTLGGNGIDSSDDDFLGHPPGGRGSRLPYAGGNNANRNKLRFSSEIAMLQGAWNTSGGQIAHITSATVTFSYYDGTVIPPSQVLQNNGGNVSLMGSTLIKITKAQAVWSDGDIWQFMNQKTVKPPRTAPVARALPLTVAEPKGVSLSAENTNSFLDSSTGSTTGDVNNGNSFVFPNGDAVGGNYTTGKSVSIKSPIVDNHNPVSPSHSDASGRDDPVVAPVAHVGSHIKGEDEGRLSASYSRHFRKIRTKARGPIDWLLSSLCCFRGMHFVEGGSTEVNTKLYCKKLRTILFASNVVELTQNDFGHLAGVLCEALHRYADELSLKERWNLISEAAVDFPDGDLTAEVTNRCAKGHKVHLPYSLHHLVNVVHIWWKCDKDHSGTLSVSEAVDMMNLLNVRMKSSAIKKLINNNAKIGADGKKEVGFREFQSFFAELPPRLEMTSEFNNAISHVGDGDFVGSLWKFLTNRQNEKISMAEAKRLAINWATVRSEEDTVNPSWTPVEFTRYLISVQNSWWDSDRCKVYHDMDQPLSHYIISSSHNTYLTGNQLSSDSSEHQYTYALMRGCKCLEIDCWDGPDGEPLVYHGHTATSKIKFKDVIAAINEHAFICTDYPVILSLEVHTSEQQQTRMAHIMKEIFKEKLHPCVANTNLSIDDASFTPNGLRGKILIKGPMDVSSLEERDSSDETPQKAKKGTKISTALSSVVFLKNTKLRPAGMTEHFAPQGKPWEVTSIVETKALRKAHSKDLAEYCEMNKYVFTRIYPKGSNVRSENFVASPMWACGSQLVALNFQTPDFPVRLNQCVFKNNGGCGYLLKPRRLRKPGVDPIESGLPRHRLILKVISGGNLPKPDLASKGEVIDPFVVVFITGSVRDQRNSRQFKTKYIDDNGFNPVWNETFYFSIEDIDLAVLTIRVMDKDPSFTTDDFIAEASCPLNCIRKGIRSIPLYSAHHDAVNEAFVLCDINLFEER